MTLDQEKNRIEELLSEIADEGDSRAAVTALEELLADRPELQQHYAKSVSTHLLLRAELSLGGTQFRPLFEPAATSAAPPLSPPVATPHSQKTPGLRIKTPGGLFSHALAATFAAIAATALISVYGGSAWREKASRLPTAIPVGGITMSDDGILIRNALMLNRVERLTRTNSLNSLLLPTTDSDSSDAFTLCSGSVWMEYAPYKKERGYLLTLAPGQSMDVLVHTNALCANVLGVMEVSPAGELMGRSLSFTNVIEGGTSPVPLLPESIGRFSDINLGTTNRYFLFTGTHKVLDQIDSEEWYASDYETQLLTDELLVLGWDDSGFTETTPAPGESSADSFDADCDYDDIRVVVRFNPPSKAVEADGDSKLYTPAPRTNSSADKAPLGEGYIVDIRPNEMALLLVSSNANKQNRLQVIDDATEEIVWTHRCRCHALQHYPDQSVYLIENPSNTVRRYRLSGQVLADSASYSEQGPWLETAHNVVATSDRVVTVGFEDGLEPGHVEDWHEMRVDIHWFADER